MFVKTYGSAVYGIQATTINVEVNISTGTRYYLVGLPDNAVKESLQRIESALTAIDCRMPRKKIVVNLSPADIRKEGSSYDLSIAIGILAGSEQIGNSKLDSCMLLGELSLDGSIQSVKGALLSTIFRQTSSTGLPLSDSLMFSSFFRLFKISNSIPNFLFLNRPVFSEEIII